MTKILTFEEFCKKQLDHFDTEIKIIDRIKISETKKAKVYIVICLKKYTTSRYSSKFNPDSEKLYGFVLESDEFGFEWDLLPTSKKKLEERLIIKFEN